MSLKLTDLEIFVAIVEAGSISRAADNLGAPKSRISRHLKELEEDLGARLLDRTTRQSRLTEEGEQVYASAQGILEKVESLQADVLRQDAALSGRLSVFAPAEFVAEILKPCLGDFARLHPALELEFLSGAARPDLLHDRLDLIIHPDPPRDSSFVAARLCRGRTDFYASPDYIADNGHPQHPSEFYHHTCIAELDQNRQTRAWSYRQGRGMKEARIEPRYRCDSMTATLSLAQQGLGIAMLPVFLAEPAIKAGSLVSLVDPRHRADHEIYGIYSSRRMKPRKLAVFLDFLKENLPATI